VQLVDLLLRDFHFLERTGDLLEGEEATFLAVGDQLAQLVAVPDRRLVSQQYVALGTHCPHSLPLHPCVAGAHRHKVRES
jgi:hypothetical protein